MTRRAFCFMLAAVMVFCLCACGGNDADAVNRALQGTWETGGEVNAIYIFEEGRFSCETITLGMSLGVNEGDYEIGSDVIQLHYDNGVEAELAYSMTDGELVLLFNDAAMVKS